MAGMAAQGDGMAAVAAIDIGTNSVKMTLARRTPGGAVEVIGDTTTVTRLGKGVDAAGRLDEAAVERTLSALEAFGRAARERGAVRVAAVGTSALRDAANGAAFVERATALLGGPVEVISGDREARLIHQAGRRDPDLSALLPPDGAVAATDVGGGSTEVIVGRGDEIAFRDSLQLGAVRLTERAGLLAHDPPTTEDLSRAASLADAAFSAVPVPGSPVSVVASGGTAANLAAMSLLAHHPGLTRPALLARLHGARLTLTEIEERIASLAAVPLAERRRTPGLEPDRADVIVAGAIIQACSLRRLGASGLIVSLRGLRYGLLYELLDSVSDSPPTP